MSWGTALRKYRGSEKGKGGVFHRDCRDWIGRKFRANQDARERLWRQYKGGKLTIDGFTKLVNNEYIAPPQRDELVKKFLSGKITDDEMNSVLRYAVPDMFRIEDLMKDLKLDYHDRNDYQKTMQFFMKEREALEMVLEQFLGSEEYKSYTNAGYPDEELFRVFMNAAVSWNVYPLWSDPGDEHRYKLLELADYVKMLNVWRGRITTQVVNKAEQVKAMDKAFHIIPQLETTDRGVRELDPYDKVLKLEPPKWVCPYCEESFVSKQSLQRHLENVETSSRRKKDKQGEA